MNTSTQPRTCIMTAQGAELTAILTGSLELVPNEMRKAEKIGDKELFDSFSYTYSQLSKTLDNYLASGNISDDERNSARSTMKQFLKEMLE